MVVNVQKLKGKIVERATTQEAVANKMNIGRTTLYRKMRNNGAGFTIGEIHLLVEAVPLTKSEAIDIFFGDDVA